MRSISLIQPLMVNAATSAIPKTLRTSDSIMLRLISLVTLIFLALSSHAQGSWDIGYIPIDSVSDRHIGREVKIDFKTRIADGKSLARHMRSYIETRDTALITVDTVLLRVMERRKINVDHGSYDDQFL